MATPSPSIRSASARWLFPILLITIGSIGAPTPFSPDQRIDRLPSAAVGDRLPPDWEVRTVRGSANPSSRVTDETGHSDIERAIRFEADGQAAFFWLELDEPLTGGETLRWSWRVDQRVDGAALRTDALDDSPARFFVVFGRDGLFSSPKILFYSWGGTETIGEHWTYAANDDFHVMVVRNERSPLHTWLPETRDPQADYRMTFGGEGDPVTGVGFMIDTDQTGLRAVSFLGPIEQVTTLELSKRPVRAADSACSRN
jgi:hypothetical protein